MSATQIPLINKQLEEIRDAIIMTSQIQNEEQSWKQIHNLVMAGAGPKLYPVGTQFAVPKETSMTASMGTHTGITGVSVTEETFLNHGDAIGNGLHEFKFDGAVWIHNGEPVNLTDYGISVTGTPAADDEILITEAFDVLLFDVVDHRTVVDPADGLSKPAMILLMHHVIYTKPFDEPEAIYYAESALAAGDYYITIENDPWKTENNAPHYFTLTQAVPAGGQIVFPGNYDRVFNGQTLKTYSGPDSTSVIESATITTTEIVGATNLGTTGTGNVNHIHRVKCGSNNYKESAIRQWINSKAVANGWWNGSNKFDRPSSYANAAGLLHGMDGEFLKAVRAITIPCKTNNTFELPGWTLNAAYTVADKFWLASRNELGYGTESVAEGTVFKAYDGAANVDRIKYDLSSQSTARNWWLRSPFPSYGGLVRYVSSSGAVDNYRAYLGYGAVAACAIM